MSDKNYSPLVPDAYQLALNTITVVSQERDLLKARVKTLEDALKHIHATTFNQSLQFLVEQALAAKEPICNCGPKPDTHEKWCATKEPIA